MGSWERLRNKRQSLIRQQHRDDGADVRREFLPDTHHRQGPVERNVPFAGNIVPTNRLSPIALALQQYYVKPTNPNAITQNFTTIFPAKLTSDRTVDRVDQNIGDRVTVVLPLPAAESENRQRQRHPIQRGRDSVESPIISRAAIHIR